MTYMYTILYCGPGRGIMPNLASPYIHLVVVAHSDQHCLDQVKALFPGTSLLSLMGRVAGSPRFKVQPGAECCVRAVSF
jgi:hypothetical protein